MPWTAEPPFPWKHCPSCGQALAIAHDGQENRPHCPKCARFYYSNPAPAVCCFVARNDEILLARRAVEPCLGKWSLPGGYVELGETAEEAILRELLEETSIRGRAPRLMGVSTKPSKLTGGVMILGFVIPEWEGTPRPDTDVMALEFYAPERRPPLAFDAHRELLALYDAYRSRQGD